MLLDMVWAWVEGLRQKRRDVEGCLASTGSALAWPRVEQHPVAPLRREHPVAIPAGKPVQDCNCSTCSSAVLRYIY